MIRSVRKIQVCPIAALLALGLVNSHAVAGWPPSIKPPSRPKLELPKPQLPSLPPLSTPKLSVPSLNPSQLDPFNKNGSLGKATQLGKLNPFPLKRSDRKVAILDEYGQLVGYKNARTGQVIWMNPAYLDQKKRDNAQDARDAAEIAALQAELIRLDRENEILALEITRMEAPGGLALRGKKTDDTTIFDGPETVITPGKPPEEKPKDKPKDKPNPWPDEKPDTSITPPSQDTPAYPPFKPRKGPSKKQIAAQKKKTDLKAQVVTKTGKRDGLRKKLAQKTADRYWTGNFRAAASNLRRDKDLSQALTQAAGRSRYFSAEDLRRVVAIESNANRNTGKNKFGYAGLFQMGPDAAKDVGVRYEDIDEPREWRKNIEAGVKYLDKNAKRLKDAGVPVNPFTSYLAHQQGPGGAIALYKAAQSKAARTTPAGRNQLTNMPTAYADAIRRSGRTVTQQDYYDYLLGVFRTMSKEFP